jgi:tripartite-type tricarboxylate transporter receptor subunit TctC
MRTEISLGKKFALAILFSFSQLSATAEAASVAEFYRDKTISIIVGSPPGSSYDLSARLIARGLTRHLPGNPKVLLQYMTGANSLITANHVYNVAPQDGLTIAAVARLTPFEPLFGNSNARFDPIAVHWLGSTASDNGVVVSWHTSSHRKTEDLFTKELVIGATVAGGDTFLYPMALNRLIGTKFKLIPGYAAPEPIAIAMERGEVQGSGSWSWSNIPFAHSDWLKDKKINLLLQLGLSAHPDIPDVPLANNFAKSHEDLEILNILLGMRKFSYPFFIAPGVPNDRATALIDAFSKSLSDDDFLSDARKQNRAFGMSTSDELTQAIRRGYSLSKEVIERARSIVK